MTQSSRPVLVVEDSASVAELLEDRIREVCGAECAVAATLRAAEDLLASTPAGFSVAVLDLNLPDARDGTVIDRILGAGIPSIVLTGSEDPELRRTLLDRGVSDYVKKDTVGVDYVARQIRRMLRAGDHRILVVDDSRSYREYLSGLLAQHGYSICQAGDGAAGLEMLRHDDSIRMVLTDYHMPGMDGLAMIAAMRRFKSFEQLAIIALSQSGGPELLARFLKGGASDFLHKSFSTEELFCRVDQNIDMLLSLAEARHASNHDYLTGLPNRRDFMLRAGRAHGAALADSSGLLIAMLDADYFKKINDRFGHHVGDRALLAMAETIRRAVRKSGLCARMGGEEFALLIPRCSRADAVERLEELRSEIAGTVLDTGDQPLRFTVSIGATLTPGKGVEDMLDRADAALYRAKADGRNRVVLVD